MDRSEPFLNDIIRSSNSHDWLIISIGILTLAYLFVRLIYWKYWRRYQQAILFGQEAQKLTHEKNVLMLQAAIYLNVLAVFSIGLFVYIFFNHFGWVEFLPRGIYGWLLTTLAVIIVVGGKYLLNQILGLSGDNIAVASQINHLWLINLKNFGFFLLPISASAAFTMYPLNEILLYSGIIILALMLILNYIKGFFVLFQQRISIYYGILYLCTLEILPVMIVWKVIRSLMD